jgi:hypothetical protein
MFASAKEFRQTISSLDMFDDLFEPFYKTDSEMPKLWLSPMMWLCAAIPASSKWFLFVHKGCGRETRSWHGDCRADDTQCARSLLVSNGISDIGGTSHRCSRLIKVSENTNSDRTARRSMGVCAAWKRGRCDGVNNFSFQHPTYICMAQSNKSIRPKLCTAHYIRFRLPNRV